MEKIEFQWLAGASSLKVGLQETLGVSGQLLKKFYSSKQLHKPLGERELSLIPLDLANHLQINPRFEGPSPKVLSESSSVVALHKPPGLHCHPHSYSDKDTVLNFLAQEKIFSPLLINQENYDRGLLYRLDFETSGILLLLKNERLLKDARENFSQIFKRKFYWAIVEGEFDKDGLHTHHFTSFGAKGAKQKVSDEPTETSHEGSLSAECVLREKGKCLLLINLKSGLRHQIRAQLAHLGFPIIGDELYGGSQGQRLFLHAFRYEWTEVFEDAGAELFESFFDLDRALQVSHDMLWKF